jgi:hypothetical protein
VQASDFDEDAFFNGLASCGARVLLIGRRAMVAYGLPVLTADYDLWVHADDIALLNTTLEPLGLVPTHRPEEARTRGRYVLENDEHVDVLVARRASTVDGVAVVFDDVWARRIRLPYDSETAIVVPCLDDLIETKRWASRDKDIADIRLLLALKAHRDGEK